MNRVRQQNESVLSEQTGSQLENLRDLLDIVLRRAVYTVGGGYSLASGLRDSMRRVCLLAHGRDVRPEQLLIMIKEAWFELPEPERILRNHSGDVLARVITLCIDEYYGVTGEPNA